MDKKNYRILVKDKVRLAGQAIVALGSIAGLAGPITAQAGPRGVKV